MMLPEQLSQLKKSDYIVSTSCLTELPVSVIHYYFDQIKRILPKTFYTSFTYYPKKMNMADKCVSKIKRILPKAFCPDSAKPTETRKMNAASQCVVKRMKDLESTGYKATLHNRPASFTGWLPRVRSEFRQEMLELLHVDTVETMYEI